MKQKSVLILSIVTLGAVAIAALALRDGEASSAQAGRTRLFPELSGRINDVTEVRLEKSGKSATLKRTGSQWELADRGGYPALFENVKELAVRVADLEIEEAKTKKKENHAKLGLEWPPSSTVEGEEGEAGLLTFKDASGQELASLVVGKSEWQGDKPKVFVRRAGEDQVYLCAPRQTLEVDPEVKRWIDPKFIDLLGDRVQTVSIEHADGERVEIGRSAENHTKFIVQNLPLGQNERYEGVASGVAQALAGAQLDDVRPVAEVDFAQEPVAKTRFRCVDGLEVIVESAKFQEKTWIRLAASFTPPPESAGAPASSENGAEPGVLEDGEAPGQPETKPEGKDVAQEALELNQRLSPWAFELSSYKADTLVRRMQDMLAEPSPTGAGDGGLDGLMEQLGQGGAHPEHGEEGHGEEDIESPAPPHEEGEPESAPPGGEPEPE